VYRYNLPFLLLIYSILSLLHGIRITIIVIVIIGQLIMIGLNVRVRVGVVA
jgi:hypothetical protein